VVDNNPSAQMVKPSSRIGPEFIRPLGNTSFRSLTLTSLWGPAIDLDGEIGQTIGAATTNGSLCLLYISSAPAPSLLEVMQQAILAACHAP
jgi:hypothetical protein